MELLNRLSNQLQPSSHSDSCLAVVCEYFEKTQGVAAGPVPAALHARGAHGSSAGFVVLGTPKFGFVAMPLGSGMVVVNTDDPREQLP
jgi:hypothetical protein